MKNVYSLIPLEGIILGSATELYQEDPLFEIFSSSYLVKNENKESRKKPHQSLFPFIGHYYQAEKLENKCNRLREEKIDFRYSQVEQERNAKREIMTTLQYIALDRLIKFLGQAGKKLEMTSDQFSHFSHQIVKGFCSPNITIYSHKLIEANLNYFFKNPVSILSMNTDVYPEKLKNAFEEKAFWEKSFYLGVESFKNFCSYNMDTENPRLMVPYLKNSFIMSHVFNHLDGRKISYDAQTGDILLLKNDDAINITCKYFVCRQENNREVFLSHFPRSVGSVGFLDDLEKIYCQSFREMDYKVVLQNPMISRWIKAKDDATQILEVQFLYALLIGQPDLMILSNEPKDLKNIYLSMIQKRWGNWADGKLNSLAHESLYEEPLQLELMTPAQFNLLKPIFYQMDVLVTLGPFDSSLVARDGFNIEFHVELDHRLLFNAQAEYKKAKFYEFLNVRDSYIEQIKTTLSNQLEPIRNKFKLSFFQESFYHQAAFLILEQMNNQQLSRPSAQISRNKKLNFQFNFKIAPFALMHLFQKFKLQQKNQVSKTN